MTTSRANLRYAFLLAFGVWLFSLAAGFGLDAAMRLENQFLDWSLTSLAARAKPDPDIVLLDIDEPTLAAMAEEHGRYPWSRAVFGGLLEGLARQKPRAVVFDILFVEPHRDHADDDLYFIKAARALPNVYFPMVRLTTAEEKTNGLPLAELPVAEAMPAADPKARLAVLLPLPGLADTGRIGLINVAADKDGVVRRYPLYHETGGWRVPSLPSRVADDLGQALPPGDTLALVWHGPPQSYHSVPLHEVFSDLERRKPLRPRDEFKDKIVVIGASATGLHDLKLTPMGANFPGPEIIATALDNLKNGDQLTAAPVWSAPLLTALTLIVLAIAFALGMGVLRLGLLAGALTAGLAVAGWLSVVHGRMHLPVVIPIVFGGWFYYLLAALRAWLLEHRNRQRVTQLFSRFLDPRVVAGLVDGGGAEAALTGQRRTITVLFSDIRGFTTLSEQKTPAEIVEILNRYFSLQVEVVFRHGGTLDKYIGDAIMAFWGAPADQPDHATRALAAARDMEQELIRFKAELGSDVEHFDIGIGLNTGEAIVGFIGSPAHRQDYTVIGDSVNTASRIEGATRQCDARILVSAATREACGTAAEFKDRGMVHLKGKEEAVHLFEPVFGK